VSQVLVTGGSGFVGSYVILQLLAAGHEVRATLRNLKREAEVRAMLKNRGAKPDGRVAFFAADLSSDAGWPEAIAGDCEAVSAERREPINTSRTFRLGQSRLLLAKCA
jgi:dihydroflavonol-4-reductase